MSERSGSPIPEVSGALTAAEIAVIADTTGRGWTVVVQGEIDVATSVDLRRELFRVLQHDGSITLDARGMSFIDSSGLGVLVEVLKRRRDDGRSAFVIRGMQEPVRRVFDITGLTDLFELEP